MLDKDLYTKILASVPVLTVDLIVENEKGKYLLVGRNNEPLKGEYYVPGGRVMLMETVADSVKRKLLEETGLTANTIEFVGYSDDFFNKNEFGLPGIHTVSLVFKCTNLQGSIILDDQSGGSIWSDKLPKRFNVIKI